MDIIERVDNYLAETKYAAGANISQVDRDIKSKTCCFLTVFQEDKSDAENMLAFKELSRDLQGLGYGHKNLRGTYLGVPERSMMVTMPIITREKSSTSEFIGVMKGLMKKYNQDSILLKLKDEENAFLLYHNGARRNKGKLKHLKDVEKIVPEFYSKIKSHAFIFSESIEDNSMYEIKRTYMAIAQAEHDRSKFIKEGIIVHPELFELYD